MPSLADLFSAQMDYIFFVYGLAFITLGVVCFANLRECDRLPWPLLGLFGFSHGLNEWLDLLASTIGDSTPFMAMRLLLMTASFAFLIEFGRRVAFRDRPPIPRLPLLVPLAILMILGGVVGGAAGLNGAARYTFGLAGCLWSSWALLSAKREMEGRGRGWLLSAALALFCYALATGLVVPRSELLPANMLHQEFFFALTGVPIQAVRALFACWIAGSIWGYERSREESSVLTGKRAWLFRISVAGLIATVGAGWLVTNELGKLNLTTHAEEVESHLSLLEERLNSATTTTRGLALTMASSPYLQAMTAPDGRRMERINSVLDRYGEVGAGLVTYVLDPSGRVVAASNRATPTSFVGKNYGFRPYFKEAMAGRPGEYFAMGVTSGEAGFYASAPLFAQGGRVIGVAVVKKSLDVDELGFGHLRHAYLVDRHGMVLLGKGGAFDSLWPVPAAARKSLSASRQFGDRPLSPLANHPLEDGEWITLDGERFLVGRRVVTTEGWSLVILKAETTSLVNRLFGIALTLLMSVLILGALLLLQREIGTEMALHENQAKLKQLSRHLEMQATTDALTGAFNRLKFNVILDKEMERARRYGSPLSLIMYDIDHFKRINDTFGHQTGDAVLADLTHLIGENIRESDLLARWGGEEFMIIAPQADGSDAIGLADKLRVLVERHDFNGICLTCSFGVAERLPGDNADTLTKRADSALYRAKSDGRNRVAQVA